jgi:hypothetical protein
VTPRPSHWPKPVYDVPLAQALRDIGAGLRPLPQGAHKKRHHFVPRFILSNFATEGGRGSPRIFQLDKTRGTPRSVRPEDAASRHRFYSVASEDSPRDNRIEDFLALVEDHAAPAINALLERPMELTEPERVTISLFLALQERRTPFGIAEAGDAAEQWGRDAMAALARDSAAFARMWREFKGRDEPEEEIEQARKEVLAIATEGRMHLKTKREQGMLLMIEGWLYLAEFVDGMDWHLLRPKRGDEFVQNDQGVARLDASTTFNAPDIHPQWLFPLAPDACLLLTPGQRRLRVVPSTARGTRDVNLRTYAWAERFIFGRTQKAVADVRAAARSAGARAAGPVRSNRRR